MHGLRDLGRWSQDGAPSARSSSSSVTARTHDELGPVQLGAVGKLIVIVCDNGGFAVINRLQVNQGGALFNNLIADSKVQEVVAVDFVPMPRPWGADPRT